MQEPNSASQLAIRIELFESLPSNTMAMALGNGDFARNPTLVVSDAPKRRIAHHIPCVRTSQLSEAKAQQITRLAKVSGAVLGQLGGTVRMYFAVEAGSAERWQDEDGNERWRWPHTTMPAHDEFVTVIGQRVQFCNPQGFKVFN